MFAYVSVIHDAYKTNFAAKSISLNGEGSFTLSNNLDLTIWNVAVVIQRVGNHDPLI